MLYASIKASLTIFAVCRLQPTLVDYTSYRVVQSKFMAPLRCWRRTLIQSKRRYIWSLDYQTDDCFCLQFYSR